MFANEQTESPFCVMIKFMELTQTQPATITQPTIAELKLAGCWNVQNLNSVESQIDSINSATKTNIIAECADIQAMDTAGALLIQKLQKGLSKQNSVAVLKDLPPAFKKIIDAVDTQLVSDYVQYINAKSTSNTATNFIINIGKTSIKLFNQFAEMLGFVGETAFALAKSILQPKRIRWRPILFNIRTAGFDALPIVGLLSFLLGIVVAYQGADQLRQYGANILSRI